MQQIREDFDRIAKLSEDETSSFNLNIEGLIRFVPQCERVVEIGCGFGDLTRQLATRARHVTAIDLSPEMIRVARARTRQHHVEFVLGDFMELELDSEGFDCVVTTATLHHLPIPDALLKMKALLKPDGVMIIRDLLAPSNFADRALDVVRLPVAVCASFLRRGRFRSSSELREAWKQHERLDHFLTFREVASMRDKYFQFAKLHRHFLWRYTLVWKKPQV